MIRKLMAIFYFLAINISCVYANDIGVDNYQYECRIGPIGVHDTFDMNQLNMLFGHITQPVQQHKFGINNSLVLGVYGNYHHNISISTALLFCITDILANEQNVRYILAGYLGGLLL